MHTNAHQGALPRSEPSERPSTCMVTSRRVRPTSYSMSWCTSVRHQPVLACVDREARHSLDRSHSFSTAIWSWLLAHIHGPGKLHGRCLRSICSQCIRSRLLLSKHLCSNPTVRGSTNVRYARSRLGLQSAWLSLFGNGHCPLRFSPIRGQDPGQ